MNCINLKQKLDRTLYCKHKKCTIKISECNSCPYKEFKGTTYKIKQRTSKQSKLEKNRFSIFTDDLDHCIFCGGKKDNLHEVIFGSNRLNSIKYGLVIPVCIEHHLECHKNSQLQRVWKKKAQIEFEKHYPDLDFIKIFGQNYKTLD